MLERFVVEQQRAGGVGDEKAEVVWWIVLRFVWPRCVGSGKCNWLEFRGLVGVVLCIVRAGETGQLSGGVSCDGCVDRSFCSPSPALPLARSARWGGGQKSVLTDK